MHEDDSILQSTESLSNDIILKLTVEIGQAIVCIEGQVSSQILLEMHQAFCFDGSQPDTHANLSRLEELVLVTYPGSEYCCLQTYCPSLQSVCWTVAFKRACRCCLEAIDMWSHNEVLQIFKESHLDLRRGNRWQIGA